MFSEIKIDPQLDLVFERSTTLTPLQIWQGWTHPETLLKWFCPRPWKVTDCRIDLKAGGEFYTVMQGPNGEKVENHGCYLEVIQNEKLVWTGMLSKGFRPMPADPMGFSFVGTLLFTKTSTGTLYRAIVAHSDEEGRKKHEQMGFQEGWGMAFNQLEELYK
jgi:uncharacterized protein YndB with AHSA1/START domain